ncbi:MAG: EpsG family protein [Butyrivibrio sp.]|nr:EpsG family protein [Butyrivibrio sp.]
MIVYLTLTAAVLSLVLLIKKNTVNNAYDGSLFIHRGMTRQDAINVFTLSLIFLGLFGVSALRLNVGNDYGTYVEHMHVIFSNTYVKICKEHRIFEGLWYLIDPGKDFPTEPGFNYLAYFVFRLSGFDNYVLIFAIFAFFTVLFFMKGMWRQSKWFAVSFAMFMFLGYYFQSMSTVRNYLAYAIALYSIEYVIKKDWPRFIFAVAVGALFHRSLLVILVFYFIASVEWKRWIYVVGGAFCVSCLFLNKVYMEIALRLYPTYEGTEYEESMSMIKALWAQKYNVLLCMLVLAASIYMYNSAIKGNRENMFYFHCNIMAFALYIFGSFLPMLSRIGYYLTITHILFVPALLMSVKDERRRKIITAFVLVGCFMYFVIFMRSYAGAPGTRLFPYKTILFDEMPPTLSERGY